MTVTYRGRAYPRSADVDTSQTFSATDEYLSPREQRRFLRLRFGSNVAGGDYQMGKPLIHLKTGDKRP